jgi:hypothetical protein
MLQQQVMDSELRNYWAMDESTWPFSDVRLDGENGLDLLNRFKFKYEHTHSPKPRGRQQPRRPMSRSREEFALPTADRSIKETG